MGAGKEKTDQSEDVSHEEWSQTSFSVLVRQVCKQVKKIFIIPKVF